jgi:hypothetical protein
MLGITVQSFLSAASGIALLLALIRGFARRGPRIDGRRLGTTNDPADEGTITNRRTR